jgi:hypothetical protein
MFRLLSFDFKDARMMRVGGAELESTSLVFFAVQHAAQYSTSIPLFCVRVFMVEQQVVIDLLLPGLEMPPNDYLSSQTLTQAFEFRGVSLVRVRGSIQRPLKMRSDGNTDKLFGGPNKVRASACWRHGWDETFPNSDSPAERSTQPRRKSPNQHHICICNASAYYSSAHMTILEVLHICIWLVQGQAIKNG